MNAVIAWCRTLALALLGIGMMTSCSETIDLDLEARVQNEQTFATYASKSEFQKVSLPGDHADRYVYMQWLERASDRTQRPLATSYVRMKYTGRLLRSNRIIDQADAASVRLLRQMKLDEQISGMSIALQNMALGDKARVVIPWYLAYGEAHRGNIPAYSALSFDIELLEISERPN